MDIKKRRKKYEELAASGKFCGSVHTAIRIHNRRVASREMPESLTIEQRLENRKILVPLGDNDRRYALEFCREGYPRRSNWESPSPTKTRRDHIKIQEKNNGRYSSRCTYTHWTYAPSVTSYAIIQSPSLVRYSHIDGDIDVSAPRGYEWRRDDNGLALIRTASGDDYHPTSDELRGGVIAIRERLLANAEKRKGIRAQEKKELSAVKKSEAEGATVCLRDSLRAGNCEAGTRDWAVRHGLDPRRHYTPSEILKMANGDRPRIAIVVTVALRRHRQEMERGYAFLSEHRS